MISGNRLRYHPYLHNDSPESELSEDTDVRHNAFEDDKLGMYVEPRHVTYGDYCGSLVERSNLEEFQEQFADYVGEEWWNWYGDYGSHGLIVRADADARVPEIGEFFKHLEDHAFANEERHSELEHEVIDEAWTDYGRNDFVHQFENAALFDSSFEEAYENSTASAEVTALYYALSNIYDEYPEVESGGSVNFRIDDIMERLGDFVDDLNVAGEHGSEDEQVESEEGTFGPRVFEGMLSPAIFGENPNIGIVEHKGWLRELLIGHNNLRYVAGGRPILQDVFRESGLEAGLKILRQKAKRR